MTELDRMQESVCKEGHQFLMNPIKATACAFSAYLIEVYSRMLTKSACRTIQEGTGSPNSCRRPIVNFLSMKVSPCTIQSI